MDFVRWQTWAAATRGLRLFGGTGKQGEAIPPVEHPERHRRAVIGTITSYPGGDKPPRATWSEDYIFAGSSAFLLLVANLFPDYWFVSFFALTPFLYRIVKATPSGSLRLGFLFGLLFSGGLVVDSWMISPLLSLLKLLCGTALFAFFAWTLGWARERWGFNPFILVLLWVGLEMGLMRLGMNQNGLYLRFEDGLLGEARFPHSFFGGLVTLFVSLMVSGIIILLNSLLVLAIVNIFEVARHRGRPVQEGERISSLFCTPGLFSQRVYLVPESRAPPCIIGRSLPRKC